MQWSDGISVGVKGLLRHKLRTLLSTLGIIFGVAAVISMMSIGEGARREVIEQIKLLGTNNIRIKNLSLTGKRRQEAERRYPWGLTYKDALLIQKSIPGLVLVAPLRFVDAEVRSQTRQSVAQIVGTSPEYNKVTNFHIGKGRFITQVDLADTKKVCVLGSELKKDLFGYGNALGLEVQIGSSWFTVIGVMEAKVVRKGKGTIIKVRNINRDIYMPITTAFRRFPIVEKRSHVDEIAIRVAQAKHLPSATRLIRDVLKRKHRGVKDYEIILPEELLAQAQRTQRLFNIVVGSIAGISLVVGGIGIMNIMLANVSERTREIGIRRAIGATRTDILTQFLIEAILICWAGGAIGILFGFGMAEAIAHFADWAMAFSLTSVFVAFGTSAAVGILFGLFPARKAAQLHPVEALRFQ